MTTKVVQKRCSVVSKVVIYGANGAVIGKMLQKCNGQYFWKVDEKTEQKQYLRG